MTSTILVNPFRCRMWSLHDRLEENISEETCKAEIESFKEHGQLIPVLGRRLQEDLTHDVELIYGARRLFAARCLNVPMLVELCGLSDRDAIVAMSMENGQRTDISPYERGRSYASWLRVGQFTSREELARTLNISTAQASRLLKLARLPSEIVQAFGSPGEMPEAWGVHLAELTENPEVMERCLQAAQQIAAESPPQPLPQEVYRMLLAAMTSQRKQKISARDRVVKDGDDAPLFRIRQSGDSMAIIVPMQGVSSTCFHKIEIAIREILSASFAAGVPSRDDTSIY